MLKDLDCGTPSFYGLEAFIEAGVMVEGLKRAGLNPSSANLVKSLETLRDWNPVGYDVSYKPDAKSGSLFVEVDVINSAGEVVR